MIAGQKTGRSAGERLVVNCLSITTPRRRPARRRCAGRCACSATRSCASRAPRWPLPVSTGRQIAATGLTATTSRARQAIGLGALRNRHARGANAAGGTAARRGGLRDRPPRRPSAPRQRARGSARRRGAPKRSRASSRRRATSWRSRTPRRPPHPASGSPGRAGRSFQSSCASASAAAGLRAGSAGVPRP
jgi:hypothetical protein